jgi:hypothetical protein
MTEICIFIKTLNVNGLGSPIKRQRLDDHFKMNGRRKDIRKECRKVTMVEILCIHE